MAPPDQNSVSESSLGTSHLCKIKQHDEIKKEMLVGDNIRLHEHERMNVEPGNNVIPSNEVSQSLQTLDSA